MNSTIRPGCTCIHLSIRPQCSPSTMSALPVVPAQNAGPTYHPPGTKVRFFSYGKHKRPNLGLRNDFVCAIGEFLGTGMFLFFALGGTNFVGFTPSQGFRSKQFSQMRRPLLQHFTLLWHRYYFQMSRTALI